MKVILKSLFLILLFFTGCHLHVHFGEKHYTTQEKTKMGLADIAASILSEGSTNENNDITSSEN